MFFSNTSLVKILFPYVSYRFHDQNYSHAHISAHSSMKRFIDILGATVGLCITGFLLIPVAIAIKLDSEGPVFYGQTRSGLLGKTFRIWKFRSMYSDADQKKHLVENEAKGHIFKNKQDPRITRVGRFLRKTSLDEFPQFWNVLMAEMSLVGTRPPSQDEVAHYNEYHWLRLRVKPGITGEWQVNGRSLVDDFEEIVSLDLDYQRKWSVWYDLSLILETIKVVFRRQGAH